MFRSLLAVARGRKWQRDIDEGKVRDIKELTEILQLDHSYVSRVLRLAHLAQPLIDGKKRDMRFFGRFVDRFEPGNTFIYTGEIL